tara:strand:- start:2927 stop:3151 length:225 start_codon:yes stop_codon:yes gene_type:complete
MTNELSILEQQRVKQLVRDKLDDLNQDITCALKENDIEILEALLNDLTLMVKIWKKIGSEKHNILTNVVNFDNM